MKKDDNLFYSGKILLDAVEYENYSIKSIEWNLITNLFSVEVSYQNQTQSKSTTRRYPLKVGGDVSINEVINTIHIMHEKFKG
jgi:hypothetical protein